MQSVWMNVMGVSLTIYRQLWALEGWDKTLTRVRQCRLCFRFINGNRSGTCVRTVLENPLLIELHWLPVAARIKSKSLILAYRVIAGSATTYLNALVRANVTPRMLRSSNQRRLALPSVQVQQSRLLSFVVPRWWNELPSTTRAGASLSTFKKRLKTQLFREHLPS